MKIILAKSFFLKLRGLMFSPEPKEDFALVLYRTSQVHTFFMNYSLALVFLNSSLEVIKVIPSLHPWRVSPRIAQSYLVIEIPEKFYSEKLLAQVILHLKQQGQ